MLSIGRLADQVEVSKSGLFAHFGSKEELQLATVEAARDIFIREVIEPSAGTDQGLPRLRRVVELWLSYLERDVFPGGCFFQAASLEFDGRDGPVRDRVVEIMGQWLGLLEVLVTQAGLGGAEPKQLAFEINAIGLATNWQRQLLGDRDAVMRGRRAFAHLLGAGR
ncbi:TetR/AcrR family transcriptional regulator [Mycobacterium riyadhense]|nr:TetR/AcrR family transcriptional regulator [Mycobacterium riyadhense]